MGFARLAKYDVDRGSEATEVERAVEKKSE
jgi:hypothetical protein